MSSAELYAAYKTKMQKIADVKYASAVLQWDQETYLPPKGNDFRGRQLATLSEMAHELFTTEAMGALLQELNSKEDLSASEKRNVQLSLEDYTRNVKLSSDFVRKMSEAVNTAYHAWVKARTNNSFATFQRPLHNLIALKKQEADLLGYEQHAYNALMNDYDKGLTVATVDGIFNHLKPQLSVLLNKIKNKPQVDNSFLHQHFDKDAQWKFGIELLKKIGFDFEAGRQDLSVHPFTTSFNNYDVRVTTRVDENDFGNMTWSCIHEGGHALYEQGLPAAEYGLPLSEYCSLSIHESQSRLWENCIGRGLPFWQHNLKQLQTFFPGQCNQLTAEQFYKGINKVQPSLIRTEADELTYHFHVMIRYEIEKMLIEGTISTKDIPAYWNEHYQSYLGVTVPEDAKGCLQDIHWSHGSFGYFATYSLGSIIAAQLYAAIEKENASVNKEIEAGSTATVLNWLRKNIHQYGREFTSEQLCKKATGEALNSTYFIDYATKKYTAIYGL
ncbi:carboxypeptidase M32 [Ferruginibacter paludis]|uniref:carboxypeptidase M32 n=1 Tax=Ferruginibacter paludis TaxID=1310417 RepID=UPI0025B59189|nr:carboxypeptidase M32 [Ferruginibacter paludis]MDN3655062.1 carboxypeptidase M32 [Ferruginibacter paludis]